MREVTDARVHLHLPVQAVVVIAVIKDLHRVAITVLAAQVCHAQVPALVAVATQEVRQVVAHVEVPAVVQDAD